MQNHWVLLDFLGIHWEKLKQHPNKQVRECLSVTHIILYFSLFLSVWCCRKHLHGALVSFYPADFFQPCTGLGSALASRCFPSEWLSCLNPSGSQGPNFTAGGHRSNTAARGPLGTVLTRCLILSEVICWNRDRVFSAIPNKFNENSFKSPHIRGCLFNGQRG